MTKKEIINYIAKQHMVEDIVHNIAGNADEDLKDLVQDIYVDLFTKSDSKLQKLYSDKQLNFYITRIALNNIYSKTSRYYTVYKKNQNNKINIDELNSDKY